MILLVDCGNTRAKWRLLGENGEFIVERQELDGSFSDLSSFFSELSGLPSSISVFFASVAGPHLREALIMKLDAVAGSDYSFVDVQVRSEFLGLRIAYSDPSELGVDRWLAMLAAYRRKQSAVLVVSVGTAVTVDKVSESGRHLGGLIAPGWRLLKASLAERTAQLSPASEVELVNAGSLGANTEQCLTQGLSDMLLSFISVATERFGGDVSSKILIGGDAGQVVTCLDLGFSVKENLVLDGLEIYCGGSGVAH